jgi:hypothetical protein
MARHRLAPRRELANGEARHRNQRTPLQHARRHDECRTCRMTAGRAGEQASRPSQSRHLRGLPDVEEHDLLLLLAVLLLHARHPLCESKANNEQETQGENRHWAPHCYAHPDHIQRCSGEERARICRHKRTANGSLIERNTMGYNQ